MRVMTLLLVALAVAPGRVGGQQAGGSAGTWSGRLQSITMHRDYDDIGRSSGSNSSLGLHLHYLSPEWGALQAGLAYDGVIEPFRHGPEINCNGDLQLLTEAWLEGRLREDWRLRLGRQVVNGEVFREDLFRQKSRAIEALQLRVDGVEGWEFSAGHAIRLSNWNHGFDRGEFNNFRDVFGTAEDNLGVSWIEGRHRDPGGGEVAVFGAHAHEVAQLAGVRARGPWRQGRALHAFYRHEEDDGSGGRGADAFGLGLEQRWGPATLEGGTFSVRGRKLLFQELTTGLNHPLGSLMLLCESPFDGGADSVYLKALCPLDAWLFYGLYSYTCHEDLPYDGHELNLVVRRELGEHLSVALKFGYGLRHPDQGANQHLSDSRLFVTWSF